LAQYSTDRSVNDKNIDDFEPDQTDG
jgi:hypothetical protein